MKTVINLRGTNGSGKSTMARAFIGIGSNIEGSVEEVRLPSGTPALRNNNRVLVGPYRTACGGCDAIKTQDAVCQAVREAVALPGVDVVLFEGVVVSTIFQRYSDLDRELTAQGHRFIWAFLQTDLDECLRRIQERNGGKEVKVAQVADKWRGMLRVQTKAEDAGHTTFPVLSHSDLKVWVS